MNDIEITLFGAISVRAGGRAVTCLTFKQRQLLAILALAGGTPVSRELLADQLWDGSPPRTWVGTLDSYVCVARRALDIGARHDSPLATTEGGYLLRAEVDLAWFHRLADLASTHRHHVALDWAEDALDLAGADLLSEVPYAAWAERARSEFQHSYVALGTRSAQLANGCGEHAHAVALARRVLTRDPLCEEAWVQLMLGHWMSGQRATALRDYAELREASVRELGEEPGSSAEELYLAILRTPGATDEIDHVPVSERITAVLRLLRAELEQVPGVRVPVLDTDLSACAARVLGRA